MQSIRKKSFAAEQLARQKKKNPWPWIVAGIALAVVVIMIGYSLFSRYQVEMAPDVAAPAPEEIPSIAVLCFDDMSQNRDQGPFCEGMAEEIINKLTQIRDIRTIARNSSFMFKGQHPDIKVVGDTLDVQYVLEGSLRKDENRIRITAQLVKVDDRSHLWSKNYDKELSGIFEVQDEIAIAIVEALKGELLGEEKAAIEKRYTDDTGAYTLYLQGRYHWYTRNYDGYIKALDCFRKAIDSDPDFAPAYTGIADTYSIIGLYGYMSSKEAREKAGAAVKKALEIDNSLAEAHVSLGFIKLFFHWDWNGAESSFLRAIELKPDYPLAHFWYSLYFWVNERQSEAHAEVNRALKYDPLSLIFYSTKMFYCVSTRNFEEAMEQYHISTGINPNFSHTYRALCYLYLKQGNYDEALGAINKAIDLSGGHPWFFSYLAYAYAKSGEREKAEQILQDLLDHNNKKYYVSFGIAEIYCVLGDKEKALDWLDKAYNEKDARLTYIKISNLFFEDILTEPRYKALLKKMKFPED